MRNGIHYIFKIYLSLLPIVTNKIVFCNYYGRGYGDNCKYIAEEIIRQHHLYEMVWLVRSEKNDYKEFPQQIRLVEYGTLRSLYELATAKIWIDNCRKVHYPIKKSRQYYIQTWHGGLGMKKCERDVEDKLSAIYISNAKKDSLMADYFIANCEFIAKLFRKSFWYEGNILNIGSPRNDVFFRDNSVDIPTIKSRVNVLSGDKVIMYAPTFRNNTYNYYKINFELLRNVISDKFGGTWKVLVRLHPNIDNCIYKNIDMDIIDVSSYNDMQELLLISDILISDYSSSIFDYGLQYRPCFLYVPDKNEYATERDFYFAFDEIPFPSADDEKELYNYIQNYDHNVYIDKVHEFYALHEVIDDGCASARVVETIRDLF